MSFFKKLFGGGNSAPEPQAEAVPYKDFRITPAPLKEGDGFRIAALIEAEVEGETKSHQLVRADVIRDREEAIAASVRKAQQMIDEQGLRLFG
ncbi:HlyU family transcriptional regulator [Salipiger sp. 1_MG-2023]|uniref:HlyU family transcriptional regulator n=1 Tax=Salipiger sp. 1_MG-2023 TaxID=3062665 RepID=UPI0026E41079|nr:HlyU family transcriptional regulator [Salipiger sp. 1_MG-2023]MDO6585406.1 HlyU family transcriptional regulator [Salipiger sp. 1_MG-2023]